MYSVSIRPSLGDQCMYASPTICLSLINVVYSYVIRVFSGMEMLHDVVFDV